MVKFSFKKWLSLLLISSFMVACGQKGDLVRPSEAKAQAEAEAKAKQQKAQK
jgi:predicted small lipoprotein YifL